MHVVFHSLCVVLSLPTMVLIVYVFTVDLDDACCNNSIDIVVMFALVLSLFSRLYVMLLLLLLLLLFY